VDDETPLGPLAEIHNIFEPKPDRNLGYPLLWSFIVVIAYVPYLAWLWATGAIGPPAAVYPFGLADPVWSLSVLGGIAHFVSVLMGAGIVVAAFDVGLTLWGRRSGVLGSLFAMVGFPMFYYSRTGNVDVPVLFFTALGLAVFARIVVHGLDVRRGLWLGVWVGCTAATKEPSVAAFVALPFALLVMHYRHARGAWRTRDFLLPFVTAAIAAACAYGWGSGLFVDPNRWVAHIAFSAGRVQDAAAGEVVFMQAYPDTLAGSIALGRRILVLLGQSLTVPGLLLAAIGLGVAAKRQPRTLLMALPAATYVLVLFFAVRGAFLRYLMPVTLLLALFAGCGASYGLRARLAPVRAGTLALAAAALLTGLLWGIDLTHAMLADTRYAAANWLAERTVPGDVVEYFGPSNKLPRLESGVLLARATEFRGSIYRPRLDETVVNNIRRGWEERRPRFIVVMPDHSSIGDVPYSGTMPPVIFDDLLSGRLGYRLAAEFQEEPLIPWIRRPALDYPMVSPPIRIFMPAENVRGS
jgi:hypothetical protein